MNLTCHLAHCVAGRIRLKLPRGRVDGAQLLGMARAIEKLPGVQTVVANPLTAGLLIHHEGPAPTLLAALKEAGLVVLTDAVSPIHEGDPGHLLVSQLLRMGKPTTPPYDLLFLLLAGLAAWQAASGHLMAPGVTLLWYAFQLRRMRETGSAPVSA